MKKSSKVATQVVEQDYTKAFELSYDLGKVLAKIGEKEADIVRMRYGLNGLTPMTLNDIAKKLAGMKQAITHSSEFMRSIDLENATFEESGMRFLETYDADAELKLTKPGDKLFKSPGIGKPDPTQYDNLLK